MSIPKHMDFPAVGEQRPFLGLHTQDPLQIFNELRNALGISHQANTEVGNLMVYVRFPMDKAASSEIEPDDRGQDRSQTQNLL